MIFYRFEDGESHWDYYSYPVRERTFKLVKETKCGYWITDVVFSIDKPKWVSKNSRKRYAYLDRAQALQSFIARKEKQIKILTASLKASEIRLKNAKAIDLTGPNPVGILTHDTIKASDDLEF